MKNLYLLITLFILAACGPSEEVNVFEGTYVGEAFGSESRISVKGSSLSLDEEACVIEDPFSTTSKLDCEERGAATIKIDEDNTITIVPDAFDIELVYKRVSGPVR